MPKTRDDETFPLTFPLGFLARTAAASAAACAVGLVLLRWVLSQELGEEFAPAFHTLRSTLGFLVPALAFSLLAVLLVASGAVFAVAVFASHTVAGPLFRLQRVAGYLGRRVLTGRIHLRAGDRGKPLAAELNRWVAQSRERLAKHQSRVEEWEALVRRCEEAADRGDAVALQGALAELRRAGEEALRPPRG